MAAPKSVTVRVPASTSNLGSGFDTLGLAVQLYLTVEAEVHASGGLLIECDAHSAEAMIREALAAADDCLIPMRIRLSSDVPVGRGLGASAALRVATISAAAALAGKVLSRQELLNRAYALEGHPDNASPAIFGGFTVSGCVGGAVRCHRFDVAPALKLVTLIPAFEMPTGEARKLLPSDYSKADTAHSLNRAAMITAALARADYRSLNGLFDDVLHQPYRQKLIPELSAIIEAGVAAGAIGGFLSGAGSAVICLATERAAEVAAAMNRVMPTARVLTLEADNDGIIVK